MTYKLLPDDAKHKHSHWMALSLSLEHLVLMISKEVNPDRLHHALNHLRPCNLLKYKATVLTGTLLMFIFPVLRL